MVAFHRLAISAFVASSLALTYWVDDDCRRPSSRRGVGGAPRDFTGVDQAIEEAILMATLSYQRLTVMDNDFKYTFRMLFGSLENVQKVREIMASISLMREDRWGHQNSNIRFHCDGGRRWTLRKDHDVPAEYIKHSMSNQPFADRQYYIPNSRRMVEEQIFVDKINGMVTQGPGRCTDMAGVTAMTSSFPIAGYSGQNPERGAVTLCEPYIDAKYPTIQSYMSTGGDVCNLKLDDSSKYFLAHTLLHELTHLPWFRRIDLGPEGVDVVVNGVIQHVPGSSPPYGWVNVVAKTPPESVRNAENYAFLGILAVLELAGCRLARTPEGTLNGALERITYFHTPSGETMERIKLQDYGHGAYSTVWDYL